MTYPWNSLDVLTAADLNAFGGSVQQLVDSQTVSVANATSTLADTGLSITVTPKSTSSLIVMHFSVPCYAPAGNAYNSVAFGILRDAAIIYGQNGYLYDGDSTTQHLGQWCMTYFDTPNTTSAVTYKLQFANHPYGSGTVSVVPSTGAGYPYAFMHLFEVAR